MKKYYTIQIEDILVLQAQDSSKVSQDHGKPGEDISEGTLGHDNLDAVMWYGGLGWPWEQ